MTLLTKTKSAKVGALKKTVSTRTGESAAVAAKATAQVKPSDALTRRLNTLRGLSQSDTQKANDRLAIAWDMLREVLAMNVITLQNGHTNKDGRDLYLLALENVTRCSSAKCGYIFLDADKCPHCGSAPMPKVKHD